MNQLKAQIQHYEELIELKKKLISLQYKQLIASSRKKLASPWTLGGAFVVGFITTYLFFGRKKQTPQKIEKQQHSAVKVVSDVSFWLALIRLVEKIF